MNWFIPFIFIYICLIINVYFVYHNLFFKKIFSEIKIFSFNSYLFIFIYLFIYYFILFYTNEVEITALQSNSLFSIAF